MIGWSGDVTSSWSQVHLGHRPEIHRRMSSTSTGFFFFFWSGFAILQCFLQRMWSIPAELWPRTRQKHGRMIEMRDERNSSLTHSTWGHDGDAITRPKQTNEIDLINETNTELAERRTCASPASRAPLTTTLFTLLRATDVRSVRHLFVHCLSVSFAEIPFCIVVSFTLDTFRRPCLRAVRHLVSLVSTNQRCSKMLKDVQRWSKVRVRCLRDPSTFSKGLAGEGGGALKFCWVKIKSSAFRRVGRRWRFSENLCRPVFNWLTKKRIETPRLTAAFPALNPTNCDVHFALGMNRCVPNGVYDSVSQHLRMCNQPAESDNNTLSLSISLSLSLISVNCSQIVASTAILK